MPVRSIFLTNADSHSIISRYKNIMVAVPQVRRAPLNLKDIFAK